MKDIIIKFLKYMLEDLSSNNRSIYQILITNPEDANYGVSFGFGADSDVFQNPFYNFYNGTGTSLISTLESIATTMCGVFFIIEFIKMSIKIEDVKYEYALSVGLKFAMARLAITMGSQLLTALTETANLVMTQSVFFGTRSLDTQLEYVLQGIATLCDSMGTLQCVGVLATLVIPFIAIKAVGLVSTVMAYGRLFELTVLKIMYPIPVGMAFLDQGRITKRFFAAYFAVCLQGAFMVISTLLFKSMAYTVLEQLANVCNDPTELSGADYFSELGSLAFGLLLASLIMLLGMMKSGQWASKVVGEG